MMNCRRAKLEISLWISDDLSGASVSNLEEHIARCSDCESYRQRLQESLINLKAGSVVSNRDLSDSIWPGLAEELPNYQEMQQRKRFHGWVLATAFSVACVAMVTFSTKQNFLSWSGEGGYDLDGRNFSQTADRAGGFRRSRKDTDAAPQMRIPNYRYLQLEKKRRTQINNKADDDTNPDSTLEEIDQRK